MQLRKQKITREIIRQRMAEMERLGLIKYPKKHGMANGCCRIHSGLSPKGWKFNEGEYIYKKYYLKRSNEKIFQGNAG